MAFKLTYRDGEADDYGDDTAWAVEDGVLKMGREDGNWTVLVSPSHWATIEVGADRKDDGKEDKEKKDDEKKDREAKDKKGDKDEKDTDNKGDEDDDESDGDDKPDGDDKKSDEKKSDEDDD
jgi:hypothetical protein